MSRASRIVAAPFFNAPKTPESSDSLQRVAKLSCVTTNTEKLTSEPFPQIASSFPRLSRIAQDGTTVALTAVASDFLFVRSLI